MPRVKPTKKIDVIGKIDLLPEKAVGQYLESKQQEAYIIKKPNWDSAGDAVEQLFIHSEIEYQQMLDMQRHMLDNQKRNAAINHQRTVDVHNAQKRLRKTFIEANHFMRECAEKREVAEKSVAGELEKQRDIADKYEKYKHMIRDLTEFRKIIGDLVKEFEPYERVLNEVVEKSVIFDSVEDCMNRCDALMLAQHEIFRMEQDKYEEIEEMRRKMLLATKEAALAVMGMKNELEALHRMYNDSLSRCHKWEVYLANAERCVCENELNKERTLDTIHHLYHLLCRRMGYPFTFQRCQCRQSLDFIREEVFMLREIIAECREKPNGCKSPSKREILSKYC